MWDYLFVMKVNVDDIKMNLKSRPVVIFVIYEIDLFANKLSTRQI